MAALTYWKFSWSIELIYSYRSFLVLHRVDVKLLRKPDVKYHCFCGNKLEGGIFNNTSNSAKFARARGILRPVLHRLNGIRGIYWMSERRDGGKRYWVKCKEAGRGMHMSVWIPICLRRAASGRVYQSSPIIYIQLLISLHLNWQRERVCSSELGRVTVEKLSVQPNIRPYWCIHLVFLFRVRGWG